MAAPREDRALLRRALLASRNAIDAPARTAADLRIAALLDESVRTCLAERLDHSIVAAYWPVQGEPDLRALMAQWPNVALPEVVDGTTELRFLSWRPGSAMAEGRFGIAIPASGVRCVPDLVIVPCLGFCVAEDGAKWRMGYGGGYYDRTLAALRVTSIGVAYEMSRLDSFERQSHDMALGALVTERARY